jgi:uncharacterized protein (UPF0332 family)
VTEPPGLVRARAALAAAELLLDGGFYADAVSRAYYAALHAAQALLASVGLEAKAHDGVHTLIGRHFVRAGKLSPELARILSRIGADRDDADYEPESVFTEQIAQADIEEARRFVDAASALMTSP